MILGRLMQRGTCSWQLLAWDRIRFHHSLAPTSHLPWDPLPVFQPLASWFFQVLPAGSQNGLGPPLWPRSSCFWH